MRRYAKSRLAIAVGVALLAGAIGGEVRAEASSPESSAAEIVAIADAAAGTDAAPASTDSEGVTADLNGAEVEVPLDPADGLTIAPDQGPAVSIGIPVSSGADGEAVMGNVVFDDAASDTAVVARSTGEGVQALVVIDGPEAPSTFRFPIEIEGGRAALETMPDGTVEVRVPGSAESGALVLPAWARDANGAAVPTHFEVQGSTLVQVVDHRGAAYPVVADPNTCGIATCTYYFGRKATKDISKSPTAVGPICAATAFIAPAVAAGCGIYAGAIAYQADRATARTGYCLKIKYPRVFTPVTVVLVPQIYSGKYCK